MVICRFFIALYASSNIGYPPMRVATKAIKSNGDTNCQTLNQLKSSAATKRVSLTRSVLTSFNFTLLFLTEGISNKITPAFYRGR